MEWMKWSYSCWAFLSSPPDTPPCMLASSGHKSFCTMLWRNLCPLIVEYFHLLTLILSTELSFLPHSHFYVFCNLTPDGLRHQCWLRVVLGHGREARM